LYSSGQCRPSAGAALSGEGKKLGVGLKIAKARRRQTSQRHNDE
jgi:hypothetical protein